jgi:hypothetical protein
MPNLRFVCAQPAILYYAWQVEVMLHNFRDMGVNLNNIDVVCKIDNHHVPSDWSKLANHYPARFFFYNDTRETRNYISSVRPNMLKQHWAAHPELAQDVIFYHDCDIAFTKPVSEWITEDMLSDVHWYGSDTRWYISHSYILSKGRDILDAMCSIMNMDPAVIEANELNAIGAQYLMKGIDQNYWARVERDCERLFRDITALNNQKKAADPSYHELQIWCADMWAVLWNAWRQGIQTICHKNFDFSWATSGIDEYDRCNIFHNAGITTNQNQQFYKADYMNSLPYGLNLTIQDHTATRQYYDLVQRVGQQTILR